MPKRSSAKNMSGVLASVGLADSRSVRTTFRLSAKAEETLKELSQTTRLSMKDLIDLLVRFFEAGNQDGSLNERVRAVAPAGRRKARVVTMKALNSLKKVAEATGTSRDQVFEASIFMLHEVLGRRRMQRDEVRNQVIHGVREAYEEIVKLEDNVTQKLEENDPILGALGYLCVNFGNVLQDIESDEDYHWTSY